MSTKLTKLSVPLPPMLVEHLNVRESARYFSLHYSSPFPIWSDGTSEGTIGNVIYSAFVNHIAVDIELWSYNLGSEETEATHHLLCDRQEQLIYIGSVPNIRHFLNAQKQLMAQADLPETELAAAKERLRTQLDEIEMRAIMRSDEWHFLVEQIRRYELSTSQQLTNWLDRKITCDLMTRYSAYARSGEYRAIQQLQKYQRQISLRPTS